MHYTTALIQFNYLKTRFNMLQFDMTLLIIWYVVPLGLLGLKAAFAGYRAWQKIQEVRRLEERITPFTSKF